MSKKIEVVSTLNYMNRYHIIVYNESIYEIRTHGISKVLGLTKDDFIYIMSKFNSYVYNGELYFKTKTDCQNASDWIKENMDSLEIMEKLAGEY